MNATKMQLFIWKPKQRLKASEKWKTKQGLIEEYTHTGSDMHMLLKFPTFTIKPFESTLAINNHSLHSIKHKEENNSMVVNHQNRAIEIHIKMLSILFEE